MALRIAQEADHFLQFVLGLIDAGHVVETDAGVGFDVDLGLALAEVHEAAAEALPAAEALHGEHPDGDENHRRQHPAENVAEQGVLDDAGEFDVVAGEILRQRRVDAGRDELLAAVLQRFLEGALNGVVGDRDLADFAGFQEALELAVGQRLDGARLHPQVVQREDRE